MDGLIATNTGSSRGDSSRRHGDSIHTSTQPVTGFYDTKVSLDAWFLHAVSRWCHVQLISIFLKQI